MDERKLNVILDKIDKDWLVATCALIAEDYPAELHQKDVMLDYILTSIEEDETPSIALLYIHHGVLTFILDLCSDRFNTDMTKREMNNLRNEIINKLSELVDDLEGYGSVAPNDSLRSSAAFSEILLRKKILPEIFIDWTEEMVEILHTVNFSLEVWNLANYFGAIPVDDLLEIQAEIMELEEPADLEVLEFAFDYIHVNISQDLQVRVVDGEEWFVVDFQDIDPEAVVKAVKESQIEDYLPPSEDAFITMARGISLLDLMKAYDLITTFFVMDEEGHESLGDVEFMQEVVRELRSPHGEELPAKLHEEMGWEYEVTDAEIREIIYQDFLYHTMRFHLKGHSQAQLDGNEDKVNPLFNIFDDDAEDYGFDEDDPFQDEDIPEEFGFKLRKRKGDGDHYLN